MKKITLLIMSVATLFANDYKPVKFYDEYIAQHNYLQLQSETTGEYFRFPPQNCNSWVFDHYAIKPSIDGKGHVGIDIYEKNKFDIQEYVFTIDAVHLIDARRFDNDFIIIASFNNNNPYSGLIYSGIATFRDKYSYNGKQWDHVSRSYLGADTAEGSFRLTYKIDSLHQVTYFNRPPSPLLKKAQDGFGIKSPQYKKAELIANEQFEKFIEKSNIEQLKDSSVQRFIFEFTGDLDLNSKASPANEIALLNGKLTDTSFSGEDYRPFWQKAHQESVRERIANGQLKPYAERAKIREEKELQYEERKMEGNTR